jgi:hypothetical protein
MSTGFTQRVCSENVLIPHKHLRHGSCADANNDGRVSVDELRHTLAELSSRPQWAAAPNSSTATDSYPTANSNPRSTSQPSNSGIQSASSSSGSNASSNSLDVDVAGLVEVRAFS